MATKKGKSDKGVTECAAGTALFREGEPGNKMYVIKSGTIRISKRVMDTEITIEDLVAGDFCGEIALVTEQTRTTSASVIKAATLIQVDAAQFENMLRSNSDIAVRMMKKMSQRLLEAQFRVSNFALRTTKARLIHQLRAEASQVSEAMDQPVRIPDNLADVLALEFGEIKALLGELVRDGFIAIDKSGKFTILDRAGFDRYLRFLELHDHFEFRE